MFHSFLYRPRRLAFNPDDARQIILYRLYPFFYGIGVGHGLAASAQSGTGDKCQRQEYSEFHVKDIFQP
jgi:hypothetical protein